MQSRKRIAAIQSSYIPWKGYFDVINSVDEFIIYDEVQYSKGDWRNRNRVKTASGIRWLTIPVNVSLGQSIAEVSIANATWSRMHWSTLAHSYARASCFREASVLLQPIYETAASEQNLSRINRIFLEAICSILSIETKITDSSYYELQETDATLRLVEMCKKAGAAEYLSGPRAKDYLQPALFADAGIDLLYCDYSGYREYTQIYPPFEHAVSILDLLFHVGRDAPKYLKSFPI